MTPPQPSARMPQLEMPGHVLLGVHPPLTQWFGGPTSPPHCWPAGHRLLPVMGLLHMTTPPQPSGMMPQSLPTGHATSGMQVLAPQTPGIPRAPQVSPDGHPQTPPQPSSAPQLTPSHRNAQLMASIVPASATRVGGARRCSLEQAEQSTSTAAP